MPIRATGTNEVLFKDTRDPKEQLIGEPDGIKATEYVYDAADAASSCSGEMGFATEQDVKRHFRGMRLFRQAPMSPQRVRNYDGQHVLGLPKSY